MAINRSIFNVNLLDMGTVIGSVYLLSKGTARWGHRLIKYDPDLLFVSAVSYIFTRAITNIVHTLLPFSHNKEEENGRVTIRALFRLISVPLGFQAGTAVHHFCYPHTKISLSFQDNCLLSVLMLGSYWISKNIQQNIW